MTKAATLHELHRNPGILLCGNAWDVGTARLVAHLGFPAIETSSAGLAFSTGRPDAEGLITRTEMLESLGRIAASVAVPVTADLENGFGDAPATVAETIALAMAFGIAGGSIEDATGRADSPAYEIGLAAERIRAAAETAGGRFVLTARCDTYMHGRGALPDVIRRLQAYQEAGADVLAAPGLPSREDLETLVREVDRPVAVFVGLSAWQPDLAALTEIGVKRASVGSGLARAALTGFLSAAREIAESGTFTQVAAATPFRELNALFRTLNRQ